jgi:fructokinase
MRLCAEDLKPDLFATASVFHFGSISLIADPAAHATEKAVKLARENKLIISYDPNVRLCLWHSAKTCRDTILATLKWANVVKINLDELEFLTGSRQLEAADKLREQHELSFLIITLDEQGAYFTTAEHSKTVPGFKIDLVEATGAGDGFTAGIISGLLNALKSESDKQSAISKLSINSLTAIVERANAIGALTCTKAGAIPALPTAQEVDCFINQVSLRNAV